MRTECRDRKEMIGKVKSVALAEQDRARLRLMLAGYCGLDGSIYPDSSLDRAVAHRLATRQVTDLGAYWPLLHAERERERELSSLIQLLLDREPAFFRDMQLYRDLHEIVLPELMASGRARLRFWSVCCGTGAGAYSLAIALAEYEAIHGPTNSEIFATDLDETALAAARRGCYPARALARLSDDLFQAYFSSDGASHCIASAVARRVTFVRHNLAESKLPPALTGMDVVIARRITNHLDSRMRNRLISQLATSLRPGGYLFAATNASTGEGQSHLEPVSTGHVPLLRKKTTAQDAIRPHPSATPNTSPSMVTTAPATPPERASSGWDEDPLPVQGFHKALETFQHGEYKAAWSELERLPADDPFWPEVYCLRAAVLVQQQRWEEAEAICQQLLAHDPWHADAHFLLGLRFHQQGQTEAAIESWKLVVIVQPEHWDTHFRLAETYRDQQDWELAFRAYRHTLNILDSRSAQVHQLSLAGLQADAVRQDCESRIRRLQWRLGMSNPPEEEDD